MDQLNTQPITLQPDAVTMRADVARLYKAANRIANLEYEVKRLTQQRDDLIDILKRTLEKI